MNPFELYRLQCEGSAAVLCMQIRRPFLHLAGWQDGLAIACYAASGADREAAIQRLQQVLNRIHQHWNEELSLADIARQEYLSPSYLSRLFQKHLHIPFSQYIREPRLHHAAQMLAQG